MQFVPAESAKRAKGITSQTSEVQAAAILYQQTTDWLHEREHILQYLDPEKVARNKRERIIFATLGGIAIGTNAVGIAAALMPNMPPEVVIDARYAAASGDALLAVLILRQSFFIASERESQRASAVAVQHWQSPFQIVIEKV